MYTIDDVIQVLIKDSNEKDYYVSLELNELPLSLNEQIEWFL